MANLQAPKQGDVFRSKHLLEPTWKPGEGQKYKDAPKALMVVTRVTSTSVYYDYQSLHPRKGAAFVASRTNLANVLEEIQNEA